MKTLLSALLSTFSFIVQGIAAQPIYQPGHTIRLSISSVERIGLTREELVLFMMDQGWELSHDEDSYMDFSSIDSFSTELPDGILQLAARNDDDPIDRH